MKRVLGIVSCALLVFVLTACGSAVPELTGMTRVEAQQAIASAGMVLGKVSYSAASADPTGTVVAQDPSFGSRASKGSIIDLTLAGSAPVAAPTLAGLDTTAAVSALSAAGLDAVVVESFSATAPVGTLISQTPAAGAVTPGGSSVKVIVSKGPAPLTVPNVVRKTEAAAKSALLAAGYKVTVSRAANVATSGLVFRQSPSAGATAKRGTSVRITVSKGGMKAQPALRGTWKGSDGTTYTFRAGSRVATPGGGVVRYRLSGTGMIFFHPAQPVYATFAWVTPDQFTLKIVKNGVTGRAVTYKRM